MYQYDVLGEIAIGIQFYVRQDVPGRRHLNLTVANQSVNIAIMVLQLAI
jgi:hypothetical protein